MDYRQILNEARLSAIATCMFLAGVRLSDNDYANPAYPRFLVLDDALIGLDLRNRLPMPDPHQRRLQALPDFSPYARPCLV